MNRPARAPRAPRARYRIAVIATATAFILMLSGCSVTLVPGTQPDGPYEGCTLANDLDLDCAYERPDPTEPRPSLTPEPSPVDAPDPEPPADEPPTEPAPDPPVTDPDHPGRICGGEGEQELGPCPEDPPVEDPSTDEPPVQCEKPGWGNGDTNHDHCGPPGRDDDSRLVLRDLPTWEPVPIAPEGDSGL